MKPLFVIALAAALAALPACRDRQEPAAPQPSAEGAPALTNRIDIPPAVRQNLGITFATVEPRAVARTVRAAGRFEPLPGARRAYDAPLGGRIEILVEQFQTVEAGQPLYRLDAPDWRQLQREIAEAEGAVRLAQAEHASLAPLLAAHREHMESLEASVSLWSDRAHQLGEIRTAGGGRAGEWAQAQVSLAEARADLAEVNEKTATLEARRAQVAAELDAAEARRELLLASAATLLGVPVERLAARDGEGPPLWRTAAAIEVRAAGPGVVESLSATSGAWVEEKAPVLATVQPLMVRFRARGLQSDLLRLRDGLRASVVPPPGGSLGPGDVMHGELAIGLTADPGERTVDLLMTPSEPAPWARAGVSGFLEVVTEGGEMALAIPLSAVVRDGLTPVVFRRDPGNPDRVIRLQADLGLSDGRWVQIRSGVREGDEVVVDGVYQLMLASSAGARTGGHFHADGTFHEEDH